MREERARETGIEIMDESFVGSKWLPSDLHPPSHERKIPSFCLTAQWLIWFLCFHTDSLEEKGRDDSDYDGDGASQVVAARHLGLLLSYGIGGFRFPATDPAKQLEALGLLLLVGVATICLQPINFPKTGRSNVHFSHKNKMVV